MEMRFPLAEGKGWLTVREEGPRVHCLAELKNDGCGLYKGYLAGVENRVLLGTLIPEGKDLILRRTFSLDELRRRGVWPPVGGEAILCYSAKQSDQPAGWQWEAAPAHLMGEPLLSQLAGEGGAWLKKEENGFCLAYPFDAGRPLPMAPLFCFVRVKRIAGRDYAVLPFSACGWPRP